VTASQLVLELDHLKTWDEADFFVSDCNDHAVRLVTGWPAWESHAAIIFGPPQSGKSHLARIWQARSGAAISPAADLTPDASGQVTPLAVEDVDLGSFDERALFHRLNLAREHNSFVLLTGRAPPGQWPLSLPDLRSRIRSYPAIAIKEPDEELLAAVLLKHFADRQIAVAPDVIPFVVARMERSMAAAELVAAHIDRLALAEHRKITRAFAAKVLKDFNLAEGGSSDDL
jgi:chromosomal replication initiation ATPase DnaA